MKQDQGFKPTYQLENIIEEVHEVEDTNVDYIANDMLKQSEELQQRLVERRRRARNINSCKNSNSKSFFKFESSNLGQKGNDKQQSKHALNNVSIIDNNMSYGLLSEDEIYLGTEPSTQNVNSKVIEEPQKPKLNIETSFTCQEDEEEEEESEDEKIEQNVINIWHECEKVYETINNENEDATSKFLENFATEKYEKIAMIKASYKDKIQDNEDVDEKDQAEKELNSKLQELEKEMDKKRRKGLSDLKKKYNRRKNSIVSKLDLESAKRKLKASLATNKPLRKLDGMHSAHSFVMSTQNIPAYQPAQKSPIQVANQNSLFPKTLTTPTNQHLRMPKTPKTPVAPTFHLNPDIEN